MKKGAWKKRIIEASIEAGTYQPCFDHVIKTLAEILEKRDAAAEQYKENGSQPCITHVNKAGEANLTKNPALVLWDDLNKSALAYWRDLGLTPSGLQKIKGNDQSSKKESKLAAALRSMDGQI